MYEPNQISTAGGKQRVRNGRLSEHHHSLLNSRIRNARILLLHCVHRSDRTPKRLIDCGQPLLRSRRPRMSTLDEITKEKQRVSEALARVDAQRQKLTNQLSELEAAERVLARYSKGTPAGKTASADGPTTSTKAAAPAQSRGRQKPVSGKRRALSLNDQVLAFATGKTQQEITAACKGARPNHVGAAIARHKRAGRIEERDGKLYATHSAGAGQHAAV